MLPKEKISSYAIIGTGAIGGYCAVKLQQAGFDVHCLLRHDYLLVREKGLTLIENDKTNTVPVKVYDDINKMPACDLVENISSFEILKMITKEVIYAAKQCGANIPDDFYEFRMAIFESFKKMEKNYSSMKDDFNAKKNR